MTLKGLNLSRTQSLAFGLIALTAALGVASILVTARWAQDREAQRRTASEAAREATSLYAQGLQMGQATRNIILEPENPRAYTNFDTAAQDFRTVLNTLRGLVSELAGAQKHGAQLRTIETDWTTDLALHKRIHQLAKGGTVPEAVKLLRSDETPLWRKYKDSILELVKQCRAAELVANSESLRAQRLSKII